ncbi:phage baseplate plug family protein [Phytobacter ursingii]|uniref:Cyanophage baseplate Pam3 plug gp18 domain-containing protein n=1 Tax=Phytobacter ursingii TaxID=1972431 RepID=A0AB35RIQ3_9ENTR|nr:hypothetical protein [Phytobacter ursingii]MDV2861859.1 hypothetical protein [Phytobacter ursingii]
MMTVGLQAVKSQTVLVTLGGQQCTIRLIQRASFLYMDLSVNDTPIFQGVPCLYGNKLIRYAYLGFKGDLVFIDSQGDSDPSYDGLGGRFILYYIEENELVY